MSGKPEAFGALYDHYLPKIYRFILIKVSHKEQAEDLTHQTFLKAWESVGSYKEQGNPFGSWLYRIARNTVIDYYRANKPKVDIEDVSPEDLGIDNSLVSKVEISIEWDNMLVAIKTLGEVEQDVLIMRFVEDMSHKDVAKAVNKSENAVKVIQHRAIKKLKENLDIK
jgi:RNA polymerase sigma-70 factor (ECF subfamily)